MKLRGKSTGTLDLQRLRERRPEDIRLWFEDYFAIHLLAGGPGGGVVEASSAVGGEPVLIHQERYVSNSDVESAWVKQADSGCQVEVRLTDEGAEKLARLTRDHIGEQLALVIDGEVVMTPTIRSEMSQQVLVTGNFTDSDCEELASGLAPGG